MQENTKRRHEILSGLVEEGTTTVIGLLKKVRSYPEFSGLENYFSLYSYIRSYLIKIGKPQPSREDKQTRRDKIIGRLIQEGKNEIPELVKTLRRDPEFTQRDYTAVQGYVTRYFMRKGLSLPPPPKADLNQAMPIVRARNTSGFDRIIDTISLKLPAGSMQEVGKLLKALRPEWQKLESAARRVPELEQKIAEYAEHVCPDADEKLRQKNEDLQRENTRLQLRVSALSRLTESHVGSEHLVVHSRG